MTVAANSIPQFGRTCQVTIGGPITPNDQSLGAHFLDAAGSSRQTLLVNGKTGGQRCKFKFEWNALQWTPNIGHVEIYGLNEQHRKFCVNAMTPVVVQAGYGDQLNLVAIMNAVQVNHKHDVAEWISKFEGGDGGRAFAGAHVSQSWAAGTPMGTVAKQLGAILGKFGAGSQSTIDAAAAGRNFKNGISVHGSPVRDFKGLMTELGLDYTVQNEQIVVSKRNGTTAQVVNISPQSGLIGSPEYAGPPQPGKPRQLKVRCLMNPLIRPSAQIVLTSASHSGQFRCITVAHSGDTYGGDWYTDLVVWGLAGSP